MTDKIAEKSNIPNWYAEIFPAGERDGFFQKFGEHAASFVDRGDHQLVISFDNLSDAGYPDPDIKPWAEKFIQDMQWSHLGVYSRGPSWYRDIKIINFFEKLHTDGFFKQFQNVALIGTSMGGFAALTFARLIPNAIVVALSPQTTLDEKLVPWETRFRKGRARDWSLPYSDAAHDLENIKKAYVVHDPFLKGDKAHVDRLPTSKVVCLKAFGCGHKTALVLKRMEKLKEFMALAITGKLTENDFYRIIRDRQKLFLYRENMMNYLTEKGQEERAQKFRIAFKKRKHNTAQEENPAVVAQDDIPVDAISSTIKYPSTKANAWMVTESGDAITYLSDQYEKRLMGFKEQDQVTLAQTCPVALGMVSYGDIRSTLQDLPESGKYHVVDDNLDGSSALVGARAMGVWDMLYCDQENLARRTVIALSNHQSSITREEALPSSVLYQSLCTRVQNAVSKLRPWDKSLFIDRVSLRLLSGAPYISVDEADKHHVNVMKNLRQDLTRITGQNSYPIFVVTQSSGTRFDGSSAVILSEGRLALDNPALNCVVATPSYPFELMDKTPSTHTPEAQMQMSEIETIAVRSIQDGKPWHCPQMTYAEFRNKKITVNFNTLSDLQLLDGPHGFTLSGCDSSIEIVSVHVLKDSVELKLNKKPSNNTTRLHYAWGQKSSGSKNQFANQGAICDSWSAESITCPGRTLRRYALSSSVEVFESIT